MAHDPRSIRQSRHKLVRRTLLEATLAVPSPPPTESPDQPGDALILALCQHVGELKVCIDFNIAAWNSALRQLSALPAQSLAGVRAKAELLRDLLPIASGYQAAGGISPDEQLLVSMLDDLLSDRLGDTNEDDLET